ncbi:MAG: hypothetical protein ABUS49_00510 [Acidobacteriota bacterium]
MQAVLIAIVLSAAALGACGTKHEAVRRCVDESGNVADDRNCASPPPASPHKYAWVYAPTGGAK